MARYLFVVPPLHGHTNPTISVGRLLRERGHEVAWATYLDPDGAILPPDATLLPVFSALPIEIVDTIESKSRGLRGAGSFHFLWQDFLLPLARSMLAGVDQAIDMFRPDVVVADQQALAGAVVAQRRGIPWATSATTSAEFLGILDHIPKIRDWVKAGLRQLQRDAGVPDAVAEKCDPRFSKDLILLFTTPEFMGGGRMYPPEYAFVGPSIESRPEAHAFPWEWLDSSRPRVLISLGTVNAQVGEKFFAAALEAFKEPDRQIVLVAPPGSVGPVPEHVLVRERVPQLSLLKHLSAVVCHGGHNTVCESLAEGLPLVVSPIRDDQPVIASQVEGCGAGLRVRFGRIRPQSLREAVDRVLTEPSFAESARQIGDSFRRAGGSPRAADRLEALL